MRWWDGWRTRWFRATRSEPFWGHRCGVKRRRDRFRMVLFAPSERPGGKLGEGVVRRLLKQMQKRGIEPGSLDYQKVEPAAGQSVRQQVLLKQGIDKELAKKIVKAIKGEKFKVQTAIQGEELRVTGKKRDDLQDVIAFVKAMKVEQPLQYKNFRD